MFCVVMLYNRHQELYYQPTRTKRANLQALPMLML